MLKVNFAYQWALPRRCLLPSVNEVYKVMYLQLSVIMFRGGISTHCMLGYTPKQTVPRQIPTPWADTHPPGQTPPWADTPLGRHPPGSIPETATVADGTHPNRMHSCFDKSSETLTLITEHTYFISFICISNCFEFPRIVNN